MLAVHFHQHKEPSLQTLRTFFLLLTPLAVVSSHADPLSAPSTLPGVGATTTPMIMPPAAMPATSPMSPPAGKRAVDTLPSTQRTAVPMQGGAIDRCSLRTDTTPHITKLKVTDTPSVVFQNTADLYGASIAQVQSPVHHLSPGDTFELSGACFGNDAGTVEIRWTSSSPGHTGDLLTARLVLAERLYTAMITEWRDNKIVARLPADISGLTPGTLTLFVRPTNREVISNTVSTAFFPVWGTAHNAKQTRQFVQILHCEATTPSVRSACRGGNQSYQPEGDFDYPVRGDAAYNTLAAAHACRAAQGCSITSKDRYRIEVPAWVIPVVTFWRDGNSHRDGGGPSVSLHLENHDAALGKPRTYLLNMTWSLVKPQEIVAYRMDIGTWMPRGLEPEADTVRMRSLPPAQSLPVTRTRMKDMTR